MKPQEISRYIRSLSNEELVSRIEVAIDDLRDASHNQNNSEWHQSCFAAVFLYGEEVKRRGLKLSDARFVNN